MAEVKDPILFPGSIDFINLKIQEISTTLAPAISAAIDAEDKDPDDILIEITELLDAMDQEVRSWFTNNQAEFDDVAANLAFMLEFYNYLKHYSPVASLLRQTDFKIWRWCDDEEVRRELVSDLAWEDDQGEKARVLSMLKCSFKATQNAIIPTSMEWSISYSQVSARHLSWLIAELHNKGSVPNDQIFDDLSECASGAYNDDEGYEVCLWAMRHIQECKIEPTDRKILKNLCISAWINFAAEGEYIDVYDLGSESDWDRNQISSTLLGSEVIELINFQKLYFSNEDFEIFATSDFSKYAKEWDGADEPSQDIKTALNLVTAIGKSIANQKRALKLFLQCMSNSPGSEDFYGAWKIAFYAVYCFSNDKLMDDYFLLAFEKIDFTDDDLSSLFSIPYITSGKTDKSSKTKAAKGGYIEARILANDKLQKVFNAKVSNKSFILAMQNRPDELFDHITKHQLYDTTHFDYLPAVWNLEKENIQKIHSSIPNEFRAPFQQLEEYEQVQLFLSSLGDKSAVSCSQIVTIFVLNHDAEVADALRVTAKFFGMSRMAILKKFRALRYEDFVQLIEKFDLKNKSGSQIKLGTLILLWLKKGSQQKTFEELFASDLLDAEQKLLLLKICSRKSFGGAWAITKLMTSGRSEEVKDLLYRANNQASGRYLDNLIDAALEAFSSDPKASTSDQLRKLIEEIDATKSVNVAVRLASIYGSDALGTANYAKKEHYCKIASELGNGESSFILAMFNGSKLKPIAQRDRDLLELAIDQGYQPAIGRLVWYLSLENLHQECVNLFDKVKGTLSPSRQGLSNKLSAYHAYCSSQTALDNQQAIWDAMVEALPFEWERYHGDGKTIWDQTWVDGYLDYPDHYPECTEDCSEILSYGLKALFLLQNNNEEKIKCLRLISYYFIQLESRGRPYSTTDMSLFWRYCLTSYDLKFGENYVFRSAFFEHLNAKVATMLLWRSLVLETKGAEIQDTEIEAVMNLHEDISVDDTVLFWLSIHFKNSSPVRSFEYLKQACDIKPDATSLYLLAQKFELGHGIPKNTTKALAYFSLAKALGDDDTDEEIKRISKQASKEQIAKSEELASEIWEKLKEKLDD